MTVIAKKIPGDKDEMTEKKNLLMIHLVALGDCLYATAVADR